MDNPASVVQAVPGEDYKVYDYFMTVLSGSPILRGGGRITLDLPVAREENS